MTVSDAPPGGGRGAARYRWGTRFAFILSGFGLGCWSAVVPFAKLHVAANDAQIGLLILCMGIGSLLLMPVTGFLASRHGSRPVIVGTGLVISIGLPLLALADTQPELGIGLFILGASLASLDVAMNAHGIEVEQASGRPLMSGFHACFSLGGFAGSGFATALFSCGISPFLMLVGGSLLVLILLAAIWPRLLRGRIEQSGEGFMWPKGVVLLLTALASMSYLTEGAIFDWGSLLMTTRHLLAITHGGLAFMLFSIGMTGGRLVGDGLGMRFGGTNVLIGGGLLGAMGLSLALVTTVAPVALVGLLLVGFGMSNTVPILFSEAGRQTAMPAVLAIATITTVSYGVTLAGPGIIGLLASVIGLATAFWIFVALMLMVVVGSRFALR